MAMNTRARSFTLFAALGAFFLGGCGDGNQHRQLSEEQVKEQLMQYNKSRVTQEDSLIDRYVRRHQLDFFTSKTGMRYSLAPNASFVPLKTEDLVSVRYRMYLMDSTLCYDNFAGEPLRFVVNGSDVASGFHELVQLTGRGGAARSIWPARLGYGVAGDLDCVPLEAVLLVDIEVE